LPYFSNFEHNIKLLKFMENQSEITLNQNNDSEINVDKIVN